MSSHYYDTPLPESKLPPTIWTDDTIDDTSVGDTPTSGDSSGSGFGGAFSQNFGKSFLDMWKNRGSGSGGTDNSKNYFSPTAMGGGSVSPLGDKGNKFLFQYTHPQATIMP